MNPSAILKFAQGVVIQASEARCGAAGWWVSVLIFVQVLQDGHGGVAAINADDGAAGVSAGAAEIHALHRSARGEALVPHVCRQAFALEDVSSGEADFLLDVWRAEDLSIDDGCVDPAIADVAAETGERFHCKGANFVAALVPCAVREPVGDVLGEDAHRVFTVGDDGGVMNALEVEFAPEVVREFAAAGCG